LEHGRKSADRWLADEQVEMLGHDDQADKRELIVRAKFAEELDEEVARANRPQEGKTSVTTASDEVQVALAVAALEACRHERNTSNPPTPSNNEGMGHPRKIK
jgi:hypothetical protein